MGNKLRRKKKLTDFEKSVLEAIKKIPQGRVTTYKEVSRAINYPGAIRAVGNALHNNPHAPQVPCHRVVKSDGSLGGYAGGIKKKSELLKTEGIIIRNNRIINFKKILIKF